VQFSSSCQFLGHSFSFRGFYFRAGREGSRTTLPSLHFRDESSLNFRQWVAFPEWKISTFCGISLFSFTFFHGYAWKNCATIVTAENLSSNQQDNSQRNVLIFLATLMAQANKNGRQRMAMGSSIDFSQSSQSGPKFSYD